MSTILESGSSVSHYRVISSLGAGGMGEVYKAHDSNLDRPVALKVLPPDVFRNDERVRRFIQEAKAASSLNHPHIVTIHEIGQAESTDSQPIHYIAMELIDGLTLKRKIHQERTDLRTLLGSMAQAAEGLAKAHAAGIVHRDLKPENIMVTRDGYAKVLDFGLAKLSVRKSADEGSTAPTEARQTREGSVMGTVGYMSPEQVQGKVVDHRSDIFSFGCILYEAATRQRPFEAESDVDVMHKILHDKPVPIEEVAPNVPAELRRMIRRCLAKDPERRYQSMKDLALELNEIVEEFDQLSISSSSAGSISSASAVVALRRGPVWLAAGAIVIAVIAAAIALYQWRRTHVAAPTTPAFESMHIERLTNSGNLTNAAISPDGKYLAHVVRGEDGKFTLLVRQIATGSDAKIAGPFDGTVSGISFSPDGNYIYYATAERSGLGLRYSILFRVPALGGTPRKLVFDVDSAPTFSPDGAKMAFTRGVPSRGEFVVLVANSDGSGERKLAAFNILGGLVAPAWSPDGKSILFPEVLTTPRVHIAIHEIDVATGAHHATGSAWQGVATARWLPDGSGYLLPIRRAEIDRRQIWLQPYPSGEPHRVTNDVSEYTNAGITADGKTIVALQINRTTHLVLATPGTEAADHPISGASQDAAVSELSVAAAGQAVYVMETGPASDIWMLDRPDAIPHQLTTDGVSINARITADGSKIAFTSRRSGGAPHLWMMDADGSNLRQLTRGSGELLAAIAPDGSWYAYSNAANELWRGTAAGPPVRFCENCSSVLISPDGRWVGSVYLKPRGERQESWLRVTSAAGGPPKLDVPMVAGFAPVWTRNSDAISYLQETGAAINVFVQPIDGGAARQITRYKTGRIISHAWLPDGKLMLSRVELSQDAVRITNWR